MFGESFHGPLVHEAVRAELAARRRGTASTKTRAEVNMTGAKAWRQKGTGRARVGALSAPHRTGGGVTFGPKPRALHGEGQPQGRRGARCARRSPCTPTAARSPGVDASAWDAPSTKQAAAALATLDGQGRVLVVLAEGEENCAKSFRNIAGVSVLGADQVGVADLVGAARLVVSEAALERLAAKARSTRGEEEA